MGLFTIAVVVLCFWAVAFAARMMLKGDKAEVAAPQIEGPTVTLSGDVMMMSHDGLHHPVAADVLALQGRRNIGMGKVGEDNTFSMQIPADVRGEIEVKIGLHGSSSSLVTAEGEDLHAVVMYNPVNNFFA